jgi:hypothetical protein
MVNLKMLKSGVRSCDVCDKVIPRGEKYAVSIVPEARAQLFRSLNESSPDLAATFTVDEKGNVRLDICLECKLRMGSATESVN